VYSTNDIKKPPSSDKKELAFNNPAQFNQTIWASKIQHRKWESSKPEKISEDRKELERSLKRECKFHCFDPICVHQCIRQFLVSQCLFLLFSQPQSFQI
jgi:hypothetical protein